MSAVARVVPFVVLALLVGACGGADEADPQQVVRDFVKATNARDGDRLCGDLLTQEYLEKATGATGDRAEAACERELALITGLRLRLVSIGDAKIDGNGATVRATISRGGQRTRQVFRLAKEDGSWKLLGGS